MNSNQIVQELVKPAFCMRFMIKLALAIYCLHLYTHVFDCLDTISATEQIKNKNVVWEKLLTMGIVCVIFYGSKEKTKQPQTEDKRRISNACMFFS